MTPLQFWFEFASTYSYPAAMRVEDACRDAGVTLEWRCFLLGPVFAGLGMAQSPFLLNPVKGAYMWQDMARICAAQGLVFRKPSVFPRGSLIAARVVIAHPSEPWTGAFVRATYRANFAEDRDIGAPETIAALLEELDLAPAPILAAAQTSQAKAKLRAQTEDARALGVFGAPTAMVGSEPFWGNDRLDMAIASARGTV